MKYTIAYIIKGEAGEYHRKLSDNISEKFGLEKLSKKIPSHLTIKAPFETDSNIEEIERVLGEFVENTEPAMLSLESFGSFSKKVIFMDVEPSSEAVELIKRLMSNLKDIPWLTFEKNDGGSHLHATLAYADSKETFKSINTYLIGLKPKFEVKLDNICILKKEEDKWVIYKEYKLGSNNE